MKLKLFTSVLTASILIVSTINIVSAYTVLNTASAIRAEGQILFTPGALLDDFSSGASTNKWNASTGTFDSTEAEANPAPATCTASYTTATGTTSNGNCLKLTYDVTNTNAFAGYVSQLGGAQFTGDGSNPTSNAISFWVKADAPGAFFRIQLKNSSETLLPYNATWYYRNTASVSITDYLDGGVTTSWQKVTIPFHNFANLDGWSSMKEFVMVFENSLCVTNASYKSGSIYIDDIRFENIAIPAVRVDYFGDKIGACALGGNIGTGVGTGTAPSLNYHSFTGGMRIDYNVIVGYAYTFIIFGGGQDIDPNPLTNQSGWIALTHDFSSYTKLTFRVRAQSVNENPKTMKIEFVDGVGTKPYVITAISDAWQLYTIPLSSVPLLNKTTIKQLTFVLEDWRINSAGGNKSGVIFIDSVQFE